MAFYSLVNTGLIYGQQWQNQYNYQSESIGGVAGGAQELVNMWNAALMQTLRAIWRGDETEFTITALYGVDIYDDTDFHERIMVPDLTGLRALSGPAVSPFVAFAFRSARWRVKRNRGYKRYAGICEDDVQGNSYDPGGSLVADIETGLDDPIVGGLATYSPTVAGKEAYVPDPLKPDVKAYRYYQTEATQRANSSGPIIWSGHRLTTQRSRIEGQGA